MVGYHIVDASYPSEFSRRESFYLPTGLDWQLNRWREVEAYPVAQPGLVF